jgi:hypothetical protein
MWKCPKCGKKVDDAFEICWACGTTVDGVENPGFLDEGNLGQASSQPEPGVPFDNLVTLIKCSLPGQAQAIRVHLESEGIPVILFNELTNTMWQVSSVNVQVPDRDLERARDILGIIEQEDELQETEPQDPKEDEDASDDSGDPTETNEDATDSDGIVDLNQLTPPSGDTGIVDRSREENRD